MLAHGLASFGYPMRSLRGLGPRLALCKARARQVEKEGALGPLLSPVGELGHEVLGLDTEAELGRGTSRGLAHGRSRFAQNAGDGLVTADGGGDVQDVVRHDRVPVGRPIEQATVTPAFQRRGVILRLDEILDLAVLLHAGLHLTLGVEDGGSPGLGLLGLLLILAELGLALDRIGGQDVGEHHTLHFMQGRGREKLSLVQLGQDGRGEGSQVSRGEELAMLGQEASRRDFAVGLAEPSLESHLAFHDLAPLGYPMGRRSGSRTPM